MKKIVYLFLLLPGLVLAQSTNQNYIKSVTYKVPSTVLLPSTTAPSQAQTSVMYLDGLGRPLQQVAVQQSATGQNIVTPITYDSFGRQDKDYLPVPVGTSLDYIDNATVISDPNSYYYNTYGNGGNDWNYRYSEKKFDKSPLSRVLEQGAPGEDWSLANGHTIKMDYLTNVESEVKLFKAVATYTSSSSLYDVVLSQNPTHYPAESLYKSVVKDENWSGLPADKNHTTEEFKNKEGQVVLKRTYSGNVQHDTYYVYDQYGNLSFVIPPLAANPSNIEVLNNLCYQYKYDSRNRLVEKKLPGKDWEFIVYDKLDRVVATGPVYPPFEDLDVAKKGWLITKYDAFNRVLLTAWTAISPRASLQNNYNNASVFSETRTNSSTTTTINNVAFNYTTVALPTAGYHVLTVNYYDDYTYVNAPTVFNVTLDGVNQVYYNSSINPRGLPTGSWVRVLQSSTQINAEKSYTLYDKKSRPVRQYLTNYLGGYTYTDSKLDFIGKTMYSITKHKKEGNTIEYATKEVFAYSEQDRLLNHTHQIISHGVPPQLMAQNEYDEMGQLKRKSVGGTDLGGGMSLQKVDYNYNIRGWLKEINNVDDLSLNADPRDLFAFKINYNKVDFPVQGVQKLYNGNISETFWTTDSDNNTRGYGYEYDALNRLMEANYHKNYVETHSYDEKLTYDKNGNISTLLRNGFIDGNSAGMTYPIDALAYTYKPNSNQLQGIYDSTSSNDGFKDANPGAVDFKYDEFGNLTGDINKGITSILYNHLNLPTKIKFKYDETNQINYLYNALGVKVGKQVRVTALQSSTIETQTDYLNGFQYVDNVLEFFPTAEGYVSVTNGDKFNYVYNYTDHLGNIRLSYSVDPSDQEVKIMEEHHYYPFGLKHVNYNVTKVQFAHDEVGTYVVLRPVDRGKYQYKYNGKELQTEHNLNLYDYGFRNYDQALGRWMNIDPLAEKSRVHSPYNYCINNPLRYIDPDGREIVNIQGGVRFTGQDAQLAFGAIKQQINETGGIQGFHFVEEGKTPNIYKNTLNAFRKGKSEVLHYDPDKTRQKERRSEALKGVTKAEKGMSLDEYPYASTYEGGSGAVVMSVPVREQSVQGAQLGGFGGVYRTLKDGDAFLVIPVPKDREPDAVREPVPVPSPVINPLPNGIKLKPPTPAQTGVLGAVMIILMIALIPIGI